MCSRHVIPFVSRRYVRWHEALKHAPWDTSTELNTFNTPKGHAVGHLIDFMVVFGAVDMARLNNAEHDHVRHVKHAARRTRQHERTMMHELHHVVDRMDAVDVLHGQERAPS